LIEIKEYSGELDVAQLFLSIKKGRLENRPAGHALKAIA
jgi:hypothetical protein